MRSQMQAVVDDLSARLGRPVTVGDADMHLLAFSSHSVDADPVRLASILHRGAPPEVRSWLMSLGIADTEDPVCVPANSELRMEARVCIPLRWEGSRLGWLWLVDVGESLTPDELASAVVVARQLSAILHDESGRQHGEHRLVRDVVAADPRAREAAAAALLESGRVTAGRPMTALVVRSARGLDHLLRRAGSLYATRSDHAVILAAADPGDFAERVQRELGEDARVGVGAARDDLLDVHESCDEALRALEIAQSVGGFGQVVRWSSLGVYATLTRLSRGGSAADAVHPGVLALLAQQSTRGWVPTLERYLDLACDVRAVGSELGLHRSSLYYRLHAMEKVAGIDLRNGEERLAVHLSLKLARLAQLMPSDS